MTNGNEIHSLNNLEQQFNSQKILQMTSIVYDFLMFKLDKHIFYDLFSSGKKN